MTAPPVFASPHEYVAPLGDLGLWRPYIAAILDRHSLADAGREPVAGFNATYPTFVCGDVVVKLFGRARAWRASHAAERAAHALLATDPEVAAPRLLAEGRLTENPDAPWPYLVTTRMSGVSWRSAGLSFAQQRSVAAELGRQIRRVHALPASGVATLADWAIPDVTASVTAAAAQSALPPHLVAQIDRYLARLAPFDRVFVHGDLVAAHVFVENGRLAGIIDWGDAAATDRHYELGKLALDTFRGDKVLLRAFLDASDWPVGADFPHRALGLSLHRQAVGLTQHHTFDVFHIVPDLLPLHDIATLDELATALFAV